MKLLRVLLLLSASLLLVAAVSACSDDDDEDDGGSAATTAPASGGGGGGETAVTVDAKDFSFDPDTFAVAAGEEVTITLDNTGSAPHTLTVYTDEEYTDAVVDADTGTVNGGDSGDFTATFDGGEYYFRCEVHPGQMTGEFEAE